MSVYLKIKWIAPSIDLYWPQPIVHWTNNKRVEYVKSTVKTVSGLDKEDFFFF